MKRLLSILLISVLILPQGLFVFAQEQAAQSELRPKEHIPCCNTDIELAEKLHSSLLQSNSANFIEKNQEKKAAVEQLRHAHPLPSTGKVKALIAIILIQIKPLRNVIVQSLFHKSTPIIKII